LKKGLEQGINLATKNIALNLAKVGTPLAVIAVAKALSEASLNQLFNTESSRVASMQHQAARIYGTPISSQHSVPSWLVALISLANAR